MLDKRLLMVLKIVLLKNVLIFSDLQLLIPINSTTWISLSLNLENI